MGWDAQRRGYLGALHHQGTVAVHYEVHYLPSGCTVDLELLSNCHAKGKYEFQPQPVTDHKLVHNDTELSAQLPLGAAGIKAQLKGDRAFRADFMYAGIDSLPFDAVYRMQDLTGPGCERATHIINRVYVGGFAWTVGESRVLDASASLFVASVGGRTQAEVGHVHSEGSPEACKQAQKEGTAAGGCQTPLHIGLLPIEGIQPDMCSDLRSCTARCDGGDASSCSQLGGMYQQGTQVPKDYAKALTLLTRSCKGSFAWGCFNLGQLHRFGMGVKPDLPYAASLYETACEGGVPNGCASLGAMYEHGEGVPADPSRAIQYYHEGCSQGLAESCQHELPLLMGECKAGFPGACEGVGYLYATGAGVPIDSQRAQLYYKRACDMGFAHGCTELGGMYGGGAGKRANPERAAAAYEKACKGNDPEGCMELGVSYENGIGVDKDLARAVELYGRGCQVGFQPACTYLGDMYAHGTGVTADVEHAAQLYDDACMENVADACLHLAELYEGPDANEKGLAMALTLNRKACDLGDPKGCSSADRLGRH